MSENKCGASFEFVKALGADAVVFEGAGRFLPVWKGNPIVNHAFIIHSGHVRYIPDINIDPEVYVHKINAPTTGDLAKSVLDFTRRGFVEPLYLVESFSVDDMAEQIVTTLLQKGRE